MGKKLLIIMLGVVAVLAVVYILYSRGIITTKTFGEDSSEETEIRSVDNLSDGCFYIWHDEKADSIQNDLTGTVSSNVFKVLPGGDLNWDKKHSYTDHTIWFTSQNDYEIPTYYSGDELIYINSVSIPFGGITWDRFSDFGYTIGVSNMIGDQSGHYRIENSDGEGYTGYVYSGSDADQLNTITGVTELFLDKIGGLPIRDDSISDGGTVLGLSKDQEYACEWYSGSYFQDFKMTANVHSFCFLETFMTYDYEFLHSNCISITIPDYLKSGYYYINGTGLFRYVSDSDREQYNGKAYDADINWNDPIILYDEKGDLIYNPSTGVDKRNEGENADTGSIDYIDSQDVNGSDENNGQGLYDSGKDTGDAGIEFDEYFDQETIVDGSELVGGSAGSENYESDSADTDSYIETGADETAEGNENTVSGQ